MTALYEITGDMALIIAQLERGEIEPDKANELLDSVSGALEDKVFSIVAAIKNMRCESAGLGHEIGSLTARKKSVDGKKSSLTKYLLRNLERCGEKTFKCAAHEVVLHDGRESVVIDDLNTLQCSHLPNLCPLGKYEFVPDREAIKAAIKAGEYDVEGAHLERKKSVRIS